MMMRRAALLLAAAAAVLGDRREADTSALLEADLSNAPIVYSLDASPKLSDHAFSALASLASIAHASADPASLRFAFVLTLPEATVGAFADAFCGVVREAVPALAGGSAPLCAQLQFSELYGRRRPSNGTACAPAAGARLPASVTFVHFPDDAAAYPLQVARVLERLCCSQRRYRVDRPELARSMGNHARFFAYLALLPLGVRRALFLDADTLVRDDVGDLLAAPLTEDRFVAAAARCAPKKAAYRPRFRFEAKIVHDMGLHDERQHVNAGVLVVDVARYCAADVVRNLDDVLAAHLAGPRLWRQGNNQPPFTIAAARHTPGWVAIVFNFTSTCL